LIRWLWTSRSAGARLCRLVLLPPAGLWRLGTAARNLRYDRGSRAVAELALPAVAVGNLTVGGSGKTPVASWIAAHYAARGIRPGILLSGYARDEVLVHQYAVPDAIVIGDPDRPAAARRAEAAGAKVLVLDDAFQLRQVGRDLNLVVVSAESARAVPWPLPAGPWREGWRSLERADRAIVTRKRADLAAAQELAGALARRMGRPAAIVELGVRRYSGLLSGRPVEAAELAGRRVVAATAIAEPASFIAQTKATGAQVQVATWPDHHEFVEQDLAWLAKAARKADHLVVTRKDAVKLQDRWPASVPEPLVAELTLHWEAGEAELRSVLDTIVTPVEPE
jgi:tetraacyldisaccharide 4'-kinase